MKLRTEKEFQDGKRNSGEKKKLGSKRERKVASTPDEKCCFFEPLARKGCFQYFFIRAKNFNNFFFFFEM
jgi:hypothetical protein